MSDYIIMISCTMYCVLLSFTSHIATCSRRINVAFIQQKYIESWRLPCMVQMSPSCMPGCFVMVSREGYTN